MTNEDIVEKYNCLFPEDIIDVIYAIMDEARKDALRASLSPAGGTAEDVTESLRNSFFKEKGIDPTDNLASARTYFVWLEKKIAEYRQVNNKK
jgi:hypothetical protein